MKKTFSILLAGAALALAACNGPKDSCEGSYKSYASMLEGRDYEGMYEMLTPESKKKVPPLKKYVAIMASVWGDGDKSFTKGFEFKPRNINESGAVCIANGLMDYTTKKLGELPVDVKDEYFSWTFHKGSDGKWYIEQPGTEKIQGW